MSRANKPAAAPAGDFAATTRFGEITLNGDKLVTFAQGIFGFTDCTQFGLAPIPGQQNSALLLLHCTERAARAGDQPQPAADEPSDVTFIVAAPENLGVQFETGDIEAAVSGLGFDPAQSQVLLILTVYPLPDGSFSLTANLRAPIVIDTAARVGVQHIMANTAYSTQHKI